LGVTKKWHRRYAFIPEKYISEKVQKGEKQGGITKTPRKNFALCGKTGEASPTSGMAAGNGGNLENQVWERMPRTRD